MTAPERLVTTPAAAALIATLRAQHGAVFFYLSHGCCDGSTPMCLAPGDLQLAPTDVQWGEAAGAAFWMSALQRDYLANLELTLDVQPGSTGAFSLEDGTGQRFVMRQRLLRDEEIAALGR